MSTVFPHGRPAVGKGWYVPKERLLARAYPEVFGGVFDQYGAMIRLCLAVNDANGDVDAMTRQYKALGMTTDDVVSILKKLSYYAKLGYQITNDGYKKFGSSLKASFPKIPATGVGYVVRQAIGVTSSRWPAYYELLRTGKMPIAKTFLQSAKGIKEDAGFVASEAADKASRGGKAISDALVKPITTASEATTSFLEFMNKHGKKIAIGGGIALALFLLGYSGLGRVLFRKKEIKCLQNPVDLATAARARYEKFNGFKVAKTLSVPKIDTQDLAQLGQALEIGYRSNKWDKRSKNYLHKFGKGVRLCSTADGKALVIMGGKMSVEDVGIIN